MSERKSLFLVPVVLGLVFASCSSGENGGEAEIATVGPAAWRVTHEGFGPLHIGQTLAEASAAVGGTMQLAAGASPVCSYAEWSAAPAGVKVMVENDTVVRIDITSAGITTPDRVKVGDSEGRVTASYPERMSTRPHAFTTGKYLFVKAGEGQDTSLNMVFETDGKNITEFRTGLLHAVEYVSGCPAVSADSSAVAEES